MIAGRRHFEKFNGTDWEKVPFEDLKEGDTFRAYEPDGRSVYWNGGDLFTATSDAYVAPVNKVWAISHRLKELEALDDAQ